MLRLSVRISVLAFLLAFALGLIICLALAWMMQITEQEAEQGEQRKSDQDLEMNRKTSRDECGIKSCEIDPADSALQLYESKERTRNLKKNNEVEPAPDFSKVGSKYLSDLDKMAPVFTNYLTKSNKPFIGYESKSSDEKRTRRAPRVKRRSQANARVEPARMRSKYLVTVGNAEVKRL